MWPTWGKQLTAPRLGAEHKALLQALAQGATLKAQRDLDGLKRCQLYPLESAPAQFVPDSIVADLQRLDLIASNMKFPTARYLLTDKGATLAATLTTTLLQPVGPRRYR